MAMINCPECGNMVSENAHKCPKCGYPICASGESQRPSKGYPQPVQSYQQTPSYTYGQNPMGGIPPKPDNKMVASILCTILLCLPLGIVAIIYSSKVDNLYAQGRYAEAQSAASTANTLNIISGVIGIISWLSWIWFRTVS